VLSWGVSLPALRVPLGDRLAWGLREYLPNSDERDFLRRLSFLVTVAQQFCGLPFKARRRINPGESDGEDKGASRQDYHVHPRHRGRGQGLEKMIKFYLGFITPWS